MKKHYRHENNCLNCGTLLQGKFCHNCGQENLEIKESFGHVVNHAVSDYFHFDHQFFYTLKPLLLKPGKLTIEYLKGRRTSYLHPIKMYIFISLVYFLLLFKPNHNTNTTTAKAVSKSEVSDKAKKEIDKNPTLTSAQKKQIQTQLKTSLPRNVITPVPGFNINEEPDNEKLTNKGDSTLLQYQSTQRKLPANERDGFWKRLVNERILWYKDKYGKNATEHFGEELQHNMPKMMFVLLPLFALVVKIAFWKNHKYYVEHLIYAIHLHCFFFLLSGLILIINLMLPESWSAVSDWLNAGLFFYTVYYIYRSLRVIYQRSRWRTISKMIGISIMYLIAYVVCIIGLIITVAML